MAGQYSRGIRAGEYPERRMLWLILSIVCSFLLLVLVLLATFKDG
jgi:UPF0716 family protein affecting phage T7 exclusion